MGRRITLWSLWAGFVTYVLLLAPPVEQDGQKLAQIIKKLSAGEWAGPTPLILTLFTLTGVVLMVYSCLLFIDGRMQKVPDWPFVLASLGTGVIGLLPYLAVREPNQELSGNKDAWLNLLDSRRTGVILTLSTLGLVAYGAIAGDWRDFIYQWQTSYFVQAMSLAFCLLCLLFPTLLEDKMVRGNFNNPLFWTLALIPLLGPLAYLCLRPPLPESPGAV